MPTTATAASRLSTAARSLCRAVGVGQPVDPFPPRRPTHRYLLGDHVTLAPWSARFRFGWVVTIAGPYWWTSVGFVGPDFDGGNWLGGMSWKQHGPIAVCRYRRRGSLLGDLRARRLLADDLDDDHECDYSCDEFCGQD